MKPLKITHAYLQSQVSLPGGKGVYTQFTLTKPEGLQMEWRDNALFCDLKGMEFMIPESNITGMVLDKSEDIVKTKK